MKIVTLRDFQLKPSNYLDELPIVLTQYGKKTNVLLTYKEYLSLTNKNVLTESQKSVNTSQNVSTDPLHLGGKNKNVLTHSAKVSTKKTMGFVPEGKYKSIYFWDDYLD